MDHLNDGEKESLQRDTIQIYTYKWMFSIALETLAHKISDESTKNLLTSLASKEAKDACDWANEIRTLGLAAPRKPGSLVKFQVRVMMTVLGTRGFLEWVLIAEDESVEAMSIKAENIQDQVTAGYTTRVVADERLHVHRNKKEVLGMEAWEMGSSGGIRDLIFGANDGLVSILALVAGVYGAVSESSLILITGIAGAIAGTISMGSGAYLSSKSEKEVTQKENQRKGVLSGSAEQKKASLLKIYLGQGFNKREAETIAERVLINVEFDSKQSIGEVTGLTTEDDWPPAKAGGLTGLSFLVASIVPILPFALLDVTPAAITAMVASIATLFGIGASKAIFTRSSWVRSGLENLVIGTLAAVATYLIGVLIPGI